MAKNQSRKPNAPIQFILDNCDINANMTDGFYTFYNIINRKCITPAYLVESASDAVKKYAKLNLCAPVERKDYWSANLHSRVDI